MLASSASLGEAKAATYCLVTNGEQMALPVLLVSASGREGSDSSAQKANPLPRCEDGIGGPRDQSRAEGRMPAGLFLIRPE